MFCKWCGKEINDPSKPCGVCGREQGALFSGNGFWDLCDVKYEKKSIAIPVEEIHTQPQKKPSYPPADSRPSDTRKSGDGKTQIRLQTACLFAAAVLCIFSVINMGMVFIWKDSIGNRIEKMSSNIDELSASSEKANNNTGEKFKSIEAELSRVAELLSEYTSDYNDADADEPVKPDDANEEGRPTDSDAEQQENSENGADTDEPVNHDGGNEENISDDLDSEQQENDGNSTDTDESANPDDGNEEERPDGSESEQQENDGNAREDMKNNIGEQKEQDFLGSETD